MPGSTTPVTGKPEHLRDRHLQPAWRRARSTSSTLRPPTPPARPMARRPISRPGRRPHATTNAATSVTGTRATLNGTVNAEGASTAVSYCYSTSSTLANCVGGTVTTVNGSPPPVTGSRPPMKRPLSGLAPNTSISSRSGRSAPPAPHAGGDQLHDHLAPPATRVRPPARPRPVRPSMARSTRKTSRRRSPSATAPRSSPTARGVAAGQRSTRQ